MTINPRLRVKGKTAPLQNGFCKTAPQRYETAQMQSLSGKDTMCVCGRRLDGCAVVGLQQSKQLEPSTVS